MTRIDANKLRGVQARWLVVDDVIVWDGELRTVYSIVSHPIFPRRLIIQIDPNVYEWDGLNVADVSPMIAWNWRGFADERELA